MIGSTGFSSNFRLLSKGFVGALIMATGLSCSDGSTAPASSLAGDLISGAAKSVTFQHSFAEKSAAADAAAAMSAASSVVAPSSMQGFAGSRISSVVATPMYSVFPVAYAPETPAVMTKIVPAGDDQVTAVSTGGWLFNFYGNNYNIVFISSNGFIGFRNTIGDGYKGGSIPNAGDAPYNNLIALAWTDLDPSAAGASYSYGIVGTAPNRKFVVQWTNVPEYDLAADPTRQKTPGSPLGHLTGQIVLSEGSNDITMYTTSLDISSSFHPVTQGIENFGGDEAAFLPGRVQAHYSVPLVNDGVRFSYSHVNQAPVVVAPANIAVNADAGLCSAVVNPGTPTVKDDAAGWSVVGVRSDALALDAAYPARQTAITWTATDAGGLKGSAAQTVTVKDAQAPTINAPAGVSVNADRGLSTATVVLNAPAASDNCGNVTVVGSRSDAQPMSTGFPVGVTTVTWKATDAAGNSASASQTVTVSGNQPPTISAPDVSLSTDSSFCSAKFEPKPNVSDDNPNGLVVVGARSDKLAVNMPYPKGLTTITWTVTDAGGLTASAVQRVTVSDRERPSIAQPANKSAGATAASANVALENPAADDNCKIVTVKGQRNDGAALSAPYPIGTTVITWSAVDPSLNLRTTTQSVTVLDISPPVFDAMPAMTVNATMPSGAVVRFAPHATDNVGVTYLGCSPVSGGVFPIGKSTVNCVAKDAAGNEAHASFDVTVLGAHDQIGNLIAKVTALNLAPGVANPLLNQLQTAYRSPGNGDSHVACVKMGDFLSLLQAARASLPLQNSSATMADDARRIMAVMGC
jgi:hypothetical protein